MNHFKLKKLLTDKQAEALAKTFLDENSFDTLIQDDADGYDMQGNLLFRFRKNVIPHSILTTGVEAFKGSITLTDGRGNAAGGNALRVRNDGSTSKISVAKKVYSGNVGYMDAGAMVPYCRKTAFARNYFDKFKEGIPFVEFIDQQYKELCPTYYKKQIAIARGTNRSYRIGETSFTTVTVNRNFQTAVHKDAGDFRDGFGNLCIYREGDWTGSYFCLPEYRCAIDMQNCDLLFVDVHRWHGNTPFVNLKEGDLRIAFVMYYREYMYKCDSPSKELEKIKMDKNGFFRL